MLSKLKDKLRQCLRKWLIEEVEEEVDLTQLEVTIANTVTIVAPLKVVGLHIICGTRSGSYLIQAHQACDQKKFWLIWKKLGGNAVWEDDGAAFSP